MSSDGVHYHELIRPVVAVGARWYFRHQYVPCTVECGCSVMKRCCSAFGFALRIYFREGLLGLRGTSFAVVIDKGCPLDDCFCQRVHRPHLVVDCKVMITSMPHSTEHVTRDSTADVNKQDLMRRMLKLDPNERASIPEIFNHSWLRFRNVTSLDQQVRITKLRL